MSTWNTRAHQYLWKLELRLTMIKSAIWRQSIFQWLTRKDLNKRSHRGRLWSKVQSLRLVRKRKWGPTQQAVRGCQPLSHLKMRNGGPKRQIRCHRLLGRGESLHRTPSSKIARQAPCNNNRRRWTRAWPLGTCAKIAKVKLLKASASTHS